MSQLRFRVARAALVTCCSVAGPAFGQTPTSTPPPPARAAEVAANSRSSASGLVDVRNLATSNGPRSVPRFEGTAAPGLKLTLNGAGSTGGRVWYRWIQTQGPQVAITNSEKVEATIIVPDETATLGFVLVVGNSAGVDARALVIEVEDLNRSAEEADLHADAGIDQTVGVGRRVVLDGKASEPRGRVRYRWVQTSGPKTTIQSTAGTTCSFVPEAAGDYQFVLLVLGTTGLVSEPAVVTVHAISSKNGRSGLAALSPDMATDELTRQAVAAIPGGANFAPGLTQALEAVADQIDSFKTYLEAATELTRRFDAVVPRDADRRDQWVNSFFKPWTARVAEAMKPTRIDLTLPEDQTKPLTKPQKARLADQFRLTGAGLRATTQIR